MHKYLLIAGVFVIALVLFFTFAYYALKSSAGKTFSRYWDWNRDKDPLKPDDLDWDSFDSFHHSSSYDKSPRIFEARCVSVQPRTYEDLQKSEEKLAESSSPGSDNDDNDGTACKLKFTLQYNTVSSSLVVHILAVKHLSHHGKGAVAYYVMIKIFPQTHRTFHTCAIKSGTPLDFNERFEFLVNDKDLIQQNLKIILCFFDRFSHHDVIGELRVDLADLESRGLMLSREILLCKEMNIIPKEKPVTGAEIMLSLGYLRLTERLAVVVISAKNLPTLDTGRPPDPYVEVRLQHGGHLLKHKKTHPKIKDCNPVFNESLTFHIPHGILHRSSLIICVKHEDSSGDDVELGRVFLGPEATGLQFEHWDEMRVNNKPIARWHKLQAAS